LEVGCGWELVVGRWELTSNTHGRGVLEHEHAGRRVGHRNVVVTVHDLGAAGHGATHGEPHDQLDALGAGVLDELSVRQAGERRGILDQLAHEHRVERLVDETGALALKLVRHAAGAEHDDLEILRIGFDRIFTMQWLYEDGATPVLRTAQSGDVELMRLLLAHGADPKIPTTNNVTALAAAAGIGWVQGVTYERSEQDSVEAVKLCLELGVDPNAVDGDGRTALHGAAHKGRNQVVELLVGHGAKLDARDLGSRDTIAGEQQGRGWLPVDYADGLVRVGVQSAIAHPETAALLRKLMTERGVPVPEPLTSSVCITAVCK
jgi:hypothetical protein